MTASAHDGVVHQIRFGFREGTGSGMGPIADSGMSRSERTSWSSAMEAHFRLHPSQVPEAPEPAQALSYFRLPGNTAAVLRRWRGPYADGRNPSHALFGAASSLTVPVALGLRTWSGWRDGAQGDGELHQLPVEDLREVARQEQPRIKAEVLGHQQQMLVQVLAQLIDRPTAGLTVLGVPEADRLPLVWGLRTVGRYVVPTSRSWSFSSYELSDGDEVDNLPEIVFLPCLPRGRVATDRVVVTAGRREQTTVEAHDLASAVVARFAQDLPIVERRPTPSVEEPVTALPLRRGVEPRPAPVVPPRPPASGSRPPVRHRATHPLMSVSTERALSDQLEVLRERSSDPAERAQIRRELPVPAIHEVAARIEHLLNFGRGQAALQLLVSSVFGAGLQDIDASPDPGDEPRRMALDIVGGSRSAQLVRAMVTQAGGRAAPLLDTVAFRWFAEQGAELTSSERKRMARAAGPGVIAQASAFASRMRFPAAGGRTGGRATSADVQRAGAPLLRAVLLGTTSFTAVAAAYAAGITLGLPLVLAVLVGVVTAGVTLSVDRAVVAELPVAGWDRRALITVFRFGLAVLLAVLLAHPLLLRLAQPEIEAQLARSAQEAATEAQAQVDDDPRYGGIPQLQAEIVELEAAVTGGEPVAVALQQRQVELQELQAQKVRRAAELAQAAAPGDGLLARVAALSAADGSGTLGVLRWTLLALFTAVGMFPVLVALLGPAAHPGRGGAAGTTGEPVRGRSRPSVHDDRGQRG